MKNVKAFFNKMHQSQDDASMSVFKTKKLPPNFAEQVLNLELDMEQDKIKIESINELIELYAIAVEYYESIHSDRFLVFQQKIKTLMTKPNIIETMDINSPIRLSKEKKLEEHSKHIKVIKSEDIKNLLDNETKTLESNSAILKLETNQQANEIFNRLQLRKQKTLNKSISEKIIDNIVVINKKRESVSQRKKTLISVDTDILDNKIIEKSEHSIGNSEKEIKPDEFKKKSICSFKRASQDLTNVVEKRMSKININEIENLVRDNRAASIKKHMLNSKNIVEEDKKDSSSDDSDTESNNNTSKDFSSKHKIQSLIKFHEKEESILEKNENDKINNEDNENICMEIKLKENRNEIVTNDKNIEINESINNQIEESRINGEEILETNKNNENINSEIINKSEDLEKIQNEIEEKKQETLLIEKNIHNKIILKEKEEKIQLIYNKFGPQITQLENQLKNSKSSGLLSKLLVKLKQEQSLQIEQINKEYKEIE